MTDLYLINQLTILFIFLVVIINIGIHTNHGIDILVERIMRNISKDTE